MEKAAGGDQQQLAMMKDPISQLREIEKWSYTELELDPNKHVTEFYKEKDKKCSYII